SDQSDGRISDGTRKRTLLRMAMAMAREGHGRANIEVVLLDVNQRRCDPPLPEREVRRVVNKAGEYVARRHSVYFTPRRRGYFDAKWTLGLRHLRHHRRIRARADSRARAFRHSRGSLPG